MGANLASPTEIMQSIPPTLPLALMKKMQVTKRPKREKQLKHMPTLLRAESRKMLTIALRTERTVLGSSRKNWSTPPMMILARSRKSEKCSPQKKTMGPRFEHRPFARDLRCNIQQ